MESKILAEPEPDPCRETRGEPHILDDDYSDAINAVRAETAAKVTKYRERYRHARYAKLIAADLADGAANGTTAELAHKVAEYVDRQIADYLYRDIRQDEGG